MSKNPKVVFGSEMINKPDLTKKEQKIKIAKKENSTLYLPLNIILGLLKLIRQESYQAILYKFWSWPFMALSFPVKGEMMLPALKAIADHQIRMIGYLFYDRKTQPIVCTVLCFFIKSAE